MPPCHRFPPVRTSVQPIRSTTALIPLRSLHRENVSGDTKMEAVFSGYEKTDVALLIN